MTRNDGEHVFWFCCRSCKIDYRNENDYKWPDNSPSLCFDNLLEEPCPGDENDYDYHECTDIKCRYTGHWYKKTSVNEAEEPEKKVNLTVEYSEGFVCDECGKESEENDDTTYAMDGTFCNEGCLQNYIDLQREEAEKKVNLTVGA